MKLKSLPTEVIIGAVALVGIASAMIITNPNRRAYRSYAADKMSIYLKEEVCSDAPQAFGNFLQKQCNNLVDVGQKPMQDIIAKSTERKNYLLFSIYETDLSIAPGLPSYQFKTIGAFQNFWLYQSKEQ